MPRQKSRPFTAEQDAWLINNHASYKTIRELAEQYNKVFEDKRTSDTLKTHCRCFLGLKQNRQFTKEQDDWLKDNSPHLSIKDTVQQFNAEFGANRTKDVLRVHVNRALKLHFLPYCRFGSGPPIGAETTMNGYVYVKTSNQRGEFYLNWQPKHQLEWVKHYGPIPKNKVIVFLDRNHLNYNINNLYAIDGRVLRETTKKQWFFNNRDQTLAAIKWCELFYAIKEVNR